MDTTTNILGGSPMDYVTQWDIILVTIGIAFRMIKSINQKYTKLEKAGITFEVKKYFDFLHVIRWAMHIITAYTMILVIPQLFVMWFGPKYMDGLDTWSFFGSALMGYLGYDMVKFIQRAFKMGLSKFGMALNLSKNKIEE